MLTGLCFTLALLVSAPAQEFGSFREAFSAKSDRPSESLPRHAVQFIVDACHLGWSLDLPYFPKEAEPLTAAVSPGRNYCVLTRPYPSVGNERGEGAVALIGSSGLLWNRSGTFLAPSVVSTNGCVAVFAQASSPPPYPPPLALVILSADGDTILTRTWANRARHFYDGLEEVYGFSDDGAHFLLTMNTLPLDSTVDRSTTTLYLFTPSDGTTRTEDLGSFWPYELEMSPGGATLCGQWPARLRDDLPCDIGFYQVEFAPWSIKKHVDRTVGPY